MKKLILITLLLIVFSGEPTSAKSVQPRHTYENYSDFVQDVKKTITIERSHKIGTEENLILAPDKAARLDFEDNPSGVKEFILFYNGEKVHLIYRYTDDTEKQYQGTRLSLQKPKAYRSTRASGATTWLHLFYEFKLKDGKAFVKFRTTLWLSEKDQEQIKEINEASRRRRAAERQAELKAVSELEWDFEEKVKPLKVIMDDPNDPNMVKLRNEYDLEGLVSSAKDDYQKLRLITGWVQKQWRHTGNNKPSKSDPLTILKEASEGKRFRCVEYAKVVAGCARSLGMPARTVGLKHPDVETAKSGAGHVVAEVWLNQFNKWVFADGQWGAIPEADGIPLNAVEFQKAIARENPGLKIRFAAKKDEIEYLVWVARYLYYFDFNLNQRFYNAETEEERISGSKGKVMLVPRGAKKPKVFQRKFPIKNCTYISNPKAFYPQMSEVDPLDVTVVSYDMDVEVLPEEHLLKVNATLALTAKEGGPACLTFELREQFEVERITQADKPLRFSRNNSNVAVEAVQVGRNSPPLLWQYQGAFKPPFDSDSMEDVIVYADEIRLTFTSHWYPKPLWSSRHAIRPSSRLAVQVPEGFMVVSGGRQQHPPLRRDGQVLYRYASTTNGSLSFAAARYAKTSIPWGDKTLEAYFFPKKPGEKPKLIVTKLPQQEKNVLETLKIAQNILDFYCRQFAPYPWGSFALVQKSKHAAYAYGVQSYVVMNKLTRVHEKTLAHEIAHQWWGNLVDPAGPGERWLTESLAEYSAFLYMEHAHASKKVVGDRREFLLSQMLNMHPIRETSFGTPGYENIIYHIGPHVFHMLRYVVGDEQFSDIMKTFTEEYANKNATVDDFIRVAERVHKESLAWFFDEWLGRTRNPAFVLESEVTKHAGNTFLVEGTISQHNTDYRMPLEIQIVGKRRKEKQRIWVEGSKTAFEYVVRHEPSEVKFAEEMAFWVLADFFHSEDERLAVSEKRPKPPPARTRNELFDIIRSKITVGRPYKLGTEIKLELEAEQAARLDCAENPYGYKEILICPLEGILYNYTFYTDLRSSGSGGGKRLASGYDHRGRSMEVRNISAWEIKDDKVHIRFRAETDKEKIKQEFREKYRKKGMTPKEIDERLAELFPQ